VRKINKQCLREAEKEFFKRLRELFVAKDLLSSKCLRFSVFLLFSVCLVRHHAIPLSSFADRRREKVCRGDEDYENLFLFTFLMHLIMQLGHQITTPRVPNEASLNLNEPE
jgi:hypothetical protein